MNTISIGDLLMLAIAVAAVGLICIVYGGIKRPRLVTAGVWIALIAVFAIIGLMFYGLYYEKQIFTLNARHYEFSGNLTFAGFNYDSQQGRCDNLQGDKLIRCQKFERFLDVMLPLVVLVLWLAITFIAGIYLTPPKSHERSSIN